MDKKSRPAIVRKYNYVGVRMQDMGDDHIATAVMKIIRECMPRRILCAKYWGWHVRNIKPLNNIPVMEITVECTADNQYCSSCESYGCPGDC